jgi:ubiquitin carboxyl-terminal hydrolase L5
MASDNDGGGDDWCTIESDPGVFTELLETLGCEHVQLEELWTLEDDSLQALRDATDNQVYGLIFLFQWGHGKQPERPQSVTGMSTAHDIPEDLFFAHQVTTNACATQAILSVVLNATTNDTDSSSGIQLGKVLSEFQSFTKDFPPPLKGMSISSSEEIKSAHNSFGRAAEEAMFFGDPEERAKRRRKSDPGEVFHFVAYLPKQDKVYELDGLQENPIVIGDIPQKNDDNGTTRDDWLSVARTAIQQRMALQGADLIKFNLMAVCQDKRVPLEKILQIDPTNDAAKYQLEVENAKRAQWKLENQRRRHNYVPLCMALLKELAKLKASKASDVAGSEGHTSSSPSLLMTLFDQAKERKLQQRNNRKR